jgi:Raf kinase inhibitor-like YbhB/YbcL family protein
MGIVGTLLRNRRAGEAHLAWNLPGLAGPQTLELSSEAFADGAAMPAAQAGKRVGGQELSPPLAWAGTPTGSAALLLVIEDVDVPTGRPFVHGLALIAPTSTALPAGALDASAQADGVRVLRPSFGRGYVGAAPIKGHGPHRYVFQLFALGAPAAAEADRAAHAKPRDVLARVPGPVLARGRLTGTYER